MSAVRTFVRETKIENMDEVVSIREFAKRIGIDEKTIRNAVKLGKISKGVTAKGLKFDVAKNEYNLNGIGTKKKLQSSEQIAEMVIDKKSKKETKTLEEIRSKHVGSDMSFFEAARIEKIAKARISTLKARVLASEYVLKEDVFRSLFEYTNEIKSRILSIPDRITDDLISIADDRNAFRDKLEIELSNMLEALSKMPEMGGKE